MEQMNKTSLTKLGSFCSDKANILAHHIEIPTDLHNIDRT